MHRFKFWWDPLGHPSLVIFLPCSPLNHLGNYAIALYGFGFNSTLCSCSNYIVILFIVHVKIIIFNWNMELNLRNTFHHKRGMGRCKTQNLYNFFINNNKINIWRNKIVNSNISTYTWAMNVENWSSKTKKYVRK
jgi:hypothetical protein